MDRKIILIVSLCFISKSFGQRSFRTSINSFNNNGNSFFTNSQTSSNCKIESHGLKTIEQVQDAIDKAKDGDTIKMDPIEYKGNLVISSKTNLILSGDSQCGKSTTLVGSVEGSDSPGLQVTNMVIKRSDNGVTIKNSNNAKIANLVLRDIRGIGLLIDNDQDVGIENIVTNNVLGEVIKTIGANKVGIDNVVIHGDSSKGDGWMSLQGDDYKILNVVGNGSPSKGILVKGCDFTFKNNVLTLSNGGHGVHLDKAHSNCKLNMDGTNILSSNTGFNWMNSFSNGGNGGNLFPGGLFPGGLFRGGKIPGMNINIGL